MDATQSKTRYETSRVSENIKKSAMQKAIKDFTESVANNAGNQSVKRNLIGSVKSNTKQIITNTNDLPILDKLRVVAEIVKRGQANNGVVELETIKSVATRYIEKQVAKDVSSSKIQDVQKPDNVVQTEHPTPISAPETQVVFPRQQRTNGAVSDQNKKPSTEGFERE